MRGWKWMASATLLCWLGACNDPAAPEKQDFELHIQAYFNDEHVSVQMDGNWVYAGTVSTDLAGVASMSRLAAKPGDHEVRVFAGGDEIRESFDLSGYLFLLVMRDGVTRQLRVETTTQRPLYE